MTFEINKAIEILSRTPATLISILSGIAMEWQESNEGEDTWSPYDIMGHFIHGEKTDWIPRSKIILSNSVNKTFEPFDRFAQMNTKEKKPIEAMLKEFEYLRKKNIDELKALQIDDLDLMKKGIHPELGEVNLRHLLSAWVVHDLGHIAQISRVMAKQYKSEVGPWIQYLGILKQ